MIYSVLKEFSSIFVDYLRLTVLGTRLKDSLVLLILGHSGDQINVWRRTFDRCFVIWKSGITEWLALFFQGSSSLLSTNLILSTNLNMNFLDTCLKYSLT